MVRGYERSEAGISRASDLDLATLDPHTMASWCALYCGGSHAIKSKLQASARKLNIGWEAELFDW